MALGPVLTIWGCLQGLAMQFFRLMYPHIGSLIGLFRLCGYCSESAHNPPGLLLGISDVQDSQCSYRLPRITCACMGDSHGVRRVFSGRTPSLSGAGL